MDLSRGKVKEESSQAQIILGAPVCGKRRTSMAEGVQALYEWYEGARSLQKRQKCRKSL